MGIKYETITRNGTNYGKGPRLFCDKCRRPVERLDDGAIIIEGALSNDIRVYHKVGCWAAAENEARKHYSRSDSTFKGREITRFVAELIHYLEVPLSAIEPIVEDLEEWDIAMEVRFDDETEKAKAKINLEELDWVDI